MHRLLGTLVATSIAAALCWVAPLEAQETPSDTLLTVQHYLDWEQVADPQISPDGTRIVHARRWVNQQLDRWDSGVWLMNADGTKPRFLTKGWNARWSPDGTRIAFIASVDSAKPQIFVRWMDAEGAVSQVSRLDEGPANLAWSPDGKWLSFSMHVPYDSTWEISLPKAPAGAKWTPAPQRVTDLHYREDPVGMMRSARTHLFVVPADGGTARQVTRGDFDVGAKWDRVIGGVGYAWTPDSRSIVFDGYIESNADLNYRNSNVHLVDIASGQVKRLISRPGTWTTPVVSPDGMTIALAGHDSTRKSYQAKELYFVGIDGSNLRLGSGALDRDAVGLIWAEDGSGVYFGAEDQGTANLYFASTKGGYRQVTSGQHVLTISSISRTGVAAGTRASPREPGDVVAVPLLKPTEIAKLTDVNGDVLGRIKLGEVEEIWLPTAPGVRVQGWVIKPPSFDRNRKYPLIMEIHGGPHGEYTVAFDYLHQNFAANGYVVLYINPRGSTGYGTVFGNAIERAYPGVDYDDLMAAVDTVVGRGYVDQRRMYVGGCSGGGVLSSWVVGHTTRFAAAAVRCPVTNWLSMSGQTDLPLFIGNFFDKPFWEDPAPWLKTSSLMYVKNVKTPTVIMTGDLDMRTPMPQSEEFYAALKMLKVPTELLRFAGEYHGTESKPSNFMRTALYMMSWYQRWPGASASP